MFFRDRTIDQIVRHRPALRACEHAASVVARFCPAADVEAYVRTCTRAERMERLYDLLINLSGAFIAPALVLSIDGPSGLIAAALFLALWICFGVDQCMSHNAELHTEAAARATSTLCEAVTWSAEELAARGTKLKIIDRRKSK